jgi:hypothetical protein
MQSFTALALAFMVFTATPTSAQGTPAFFNIFSGGGCAGNSVTDGTVLLTTSIPVVPNEPITLPPLDICNEIERVPFYYSGRGFLQPSIWSVANGITELYLRPLRRCVLRIRPLRKFQLQLCRYAVVHYRAWMYINRDAELELELELHEPSRSTSSCHTWVDTSRSQLLTCHLFIFIYLRRVRK